MSSSKTFKQTTDASKIEPFRSKEEAQQYLNDMAQKFLEVKSKVLELEDAAFVCIIKTQKACQEKVDSLKKEKNK